MTSSAPSGGQNLKQLFGAVQAPADAAFGSFLASYTKKSVAYVEPPAYSPPIEADMVEWSSGSVEQDRVLYIIKLLGDCVSREHGGYLSPTLFVPLAVWHPTQYDLRVAAFNAKHTYLRATTLLLNQLVSDVDSTFSRYPACASLLAVAPAVAAPAGGSTAAPSWHELVACVSQLAASTAAAAQRAWQLERALAADAACVPTLALAGSSNASAVGAPSASAARAPYCQRYLVRTEPAASAAPAAAAETPSSPLRTFGDGSGAGALAASPLLGRPVPGAQQQQQQQYEAEPWSPSASGLLSPASPGGLAGLASPSAGSGTGAESVVTVGPVTPLERTPPSADVVGWETDLLALLPPGCPTGAATHTAAGCAQATLFGVLLRPLLLQRARLVAPPPRVAAITGPLPMDAAVAAAAAAAAAAFAADPAAEPAPAPVKEKTGFFSRVRKMVETAVQEATRFGRSAMAAKLTREQALDYAISVAAACEAAQTLQPLRRRVGFLVSHPSFPSGAGGYARALPAEPALRVLQAEAVEDADAGLEADARGAGGVALGDEAVAVHIGGQEIARALDGVVGSLQRALISLVTDDLARNLALFNEAQEGTFSG
jgi:hypothetical protein